MPEQGVGKDNFKRVTDNTNINLVVSSISK